MILSDDHPLLTNLAEVDQICSPLKYLGITYFHFGRMRNNGSVYVLSNSNASWHKYVFKMEQPASSNLHSLPSGYYFWSDIYPEQMNANAHNDFNIAHAVSILKHYKGYYDIYAFATNSKNHQSTSFFLNNIDILEKFILYFQEKAKDLIQIAKKSPIIVPSSMIKDNHLKPIKSNQKEIMFEQFHQSLKLKRFTINTKFGSAHITRREAECLNLIAKGKN